MSVIVVLLLIASVVFLFVRLRSGETLSFETTADPHRAIAGLLCLLAARRRWQTVSQGEHGAHFECDEGPNRPIALMLLLCFLLPGLVYIALIRRRESLVVSVGSAGAGTFVRVASNGRRGKAVGRALRRRVGFAAALGSCVNAVSGRSPSTLQAPATASLGFAAGPPPPAWQLLPHSAHSGLAPAPRSASTPALVAIISGPEILAAEIGDDVIVPPHVWSGLDDRVLLAQELHT